MKKKKPLAKRIQEWLDADFNRAVTFYPLNVGYQCQVRKTVDGKREWSEFWQGDTLDEAFTEASDMES